MDGPTIKIPDDVIEPIIASHISAAVATALVDKDKLVRAAIERVLRAKVDRSGNSSNYSDAVPWLQWVMNDCVERATRDAIASALEGHRSALEKTIVSELNKTNSRLAKQIACAMVGGLADAAKNKWRLTVTMDKDA